jgi:hypothetical protein
LSDDAVPAGAIKELNANLRNYNFSVYVDGRELFKPIYLKGNPEGYTTEKILATELAVYGDKLKYSG